MFRKKQTLLVVVLALSALALPAFSQEADATTDLDPIEFVLDFVDETLEIIWATFGPEMEPIGSSTSSPGQDQSGILEIGPGMEPVGESHTPSTEESLPDFGPEMEPVG